MKKIIFIILLLALIPTVTALGISPVKTVWEFHPEKEVTGTLKIVRIGGGPLEYALSTSGPLDIQIQPTVIFEPDETIKAVSFRATLPERVVEGKSLITVSQSPTPGAGMRSLVALNHVVELRTPPLSTHFSYTLEPEPIVTAEVTNPGQDAQLVMMTLNVTEGQQSLDFKESEKETIAYGEKTILSIKVPNLETGHYGGAITVLSDTNKVTGGVDLRIGSPYVHIDNIEENNIQLRSNWNEKLVFMNIQMDVKTEDTIVYSKALPDVSFPSRGTAIIPLDIDLPKDYEILITGSIAGDKITTQYSERFSVTKKSIIAFLGLLVLLAANIALLWALIRLIRY
jgi:hypothetical protein